MQQNEESVFQNLEGDWENHLSTTFTICYCQFSLVTTAGGLLLVQWGTLDSLRLTKATKE